MRGYVRGEEVREYHLADLPERSEQTSGEQPTGESRVVEVSGQALTNLKEKLAQDLYKMSPGEAISQDLCIDCKMPALPRCYSDAGRNEYRISGLCEQCFDKIFA